MNAAVEAKRASLRNQEEANGKTDAPPPDDMTDTSLVGCEMGGERGTTPVFSRGMNPEQFSMAILALANLLRPGGFLVAFNFWKTTYLILSNQLNQPYNIKKVFLTKNFLHPVGDFSSRVTNMINQMGQNESHRDATKGLAANKPHAATVWDSFDGYLRTYIDPIEALDPDDDSSDGKSLVQTVRAAMARRGRKIKLGESDKIEMVYLNEIMATLQEEGQLLPLRQTFDFYTLPKEQRDQVLTSTKGKAHLDLMWDPEMPWEAKQEVRRMSLAAWGSFCAQCGLDHRLNISLGACFAAMLEKPSTSVEAVDDFLEGRAGFDPDKISVSMDGFLASLQGIIMRHTLAKDCVKGEIARLDSKTMLKGIMEVVHQIFDKSPINRFLKLKKTRTSRLQLGTKGAQLKRTGSRV